MGDNDYQLAFLDYFCDDRNKFDYAVMIDAPWGSGKTHFLKDYLRSKYRPSSAVPPEPPEYLWVSLFGRTNASEVRDALFASAHPLLSSKWGALAGSVMSGLLKKFAGFDTDKAVAKEFFLDVKAKLVVFDDLERSPMGPKDALGLINSFVDDSTFKVIVVGNQAEIADHKEYRTQKEKVIGRTLTIKADPEKVLTSLIRQLRNAEAQEAITTNRDDLLAVFRASDYHNFRSLRAALDDFDRLVQAADPRLASSPEALRALMLYLVAVGMEVRADTVRGDMLDEFLRAASRLSFSQKPDAAAAETKKIVEKYPSVDWHSPLVSPTILHGLITSGLLRTEAVNEGLLVHPLIVGSKHVPTWLALWNWTRLTKTEYVATKDDLIAKLKAHVLVHPGELLHIISVLLSLTEFGDSPIPDVETYFRNYIDDRVADGTLVADISAFESLHGWRGYGYQQKDNPIFQALYEHVHAAAKTVHKGEMARKATELLLRLPTPGAERDLYEFDREAGQVGGIPLLQNIAFSSFADLLLQDCRYDDRLMAALHQRYEVGQGFPDLADEESWLVDLEAELRNRAKAAPPPFSQLLLDRTNYSFGRMRKNIDAIKQAASR